MCLVPNQTTQEADNLAIVYYPSLEAAGWTPPATIGGTWCRVSPEGIYEFWPHLETSVEIILVACITTLLKITTNIPKELHDPNTKGD